MAIQNSALVRDNSTLANFKSWASTISAFFATAGWTQSTDTGQVNWSTIAAVPGSGSYVYEIWEPNDGLTNFFLKVEYGTNAASGSTGPSIRISIGTSTNGAGTLTGFVTGLQTIPPVQTTVTSTVTQFQCYFSGVAGRIGVLMWRDDTTNAGPLFFGVERSINSSGAYTSSYVTLISSGNTGSASCESWMQSVVFGVGVSNQIVASAVSTNSLPALDTGLASDVFNGNFAISPVFPNVGFFDNPMTIVALAAASDITEGATFAILAANMPYGVSHTYLGAKNPPFNRFGTYVALNNALLMRYD